MPTSDAVAAAERLLKLAQTAAADAQRERTAAVVAAQRRLADATRQAEEEDE